MNQRFDLVLGSAWYLIVVGAMLLTLPAIVWRRRLGYLAGISLLGACVVIVAGLADADSQQSVAVNNLQYGTESLTSTMLSMQSQHGGMTFAFIRTTVRSKGILDSRDPSPVLRWFRSTRPPGALKYPGKSWVFGQFLNTDDDPSKGLVILNNWQIMVPDILVIALLLVVPGLWLRRFLVSQRSRRWKREGRCERCGYPLQNLQAVEGRLICPECGFIATEVNEAIPAPGAA